MQIVKLSLAAMIAVIVVVNGAVGSIGRKGNVEVGQGKNVDIWVQENYATVLNKILPTGEVAVGQFSKNVKWMVTVRILPPFEKPEYRFSMQKFYDGRVEVGCTPFVRQKVKRHQYRVENSSCHRLIVLPQSAAVGEAEASSAGGQLARNSQLETHRDDEPGAAVTAAAPSPRTAHRIDRFPYA